MKCLVFYIGVLAASQELNDCVDIQIISHDCKTAAAHFQLPHNTCHTNHVLCDIRLRLRFGKQQGVYGHCLTALCCTLRIAYQQLIVIANAFQSDCNDSITTTGTYIITTTMSTTATITSGTATTGIILTTAFFSYY